MLRERLRKWRKMTIMGASLGAAVIFFVAGIIFWGGFNTVMEATNNMTFCSSACHEMSWVYEEYQERPHYENATGVGAQCSDCHVPDAWGPKMIRKIKASREVWHWMLGTIDTKEEFEGKRLHLAENVWRSMLRTDSRECRNCHDWSAMDLEEQANRASREHARGFEQGQTCIECHQGIAHELPEAWDESPVWADRFDYGTVDEEGDLLGDEPELTAALEEEDLGEAKEVEENVAATLDWSEVPTQEVTLFLPGQASIEWIQDGGEHGGGRAFSYGDRCIWCHQGEEADIGALAVSGEKIETYDLGEKRGHVPMSIQASFDDDYLFMRFQWEAGEHAPLPFVEGGMMDPENPMKLTVSLSDDKVDMADRAGCWASCHHDSRDMPDAPEEQALAETELAERLDLMNGVTKYLSESRTDIEIRGRRGAKRGGWDKLKEEAEIEELLNGGVYLDLARYKSGDGSTESGYVLDERHFTESQAIVFSADEQDGVWTAHLTRALKTGAEGDKPINLDGKYNLNVALHDDHADSRFHHVSWQYGLAFDAEIPGDFEEDFVEINAARISR
ncbi:NapC/NirT family cytochrome c [Halomonas lysinitropha]|uniref:Denitrification system component NirT n=1 Tax=Halomonas lysinitropha TaxID=2607506 RepID=A0A5K1I1M7_9GAMM|nr:NapC/NirT family cytochrome c [Halomonas lysinitropha]VVZ94008.1 Denitrification system component NirT [Halomonas lysinitropha]